MKLDAAYRFHHGKQMMINPGISRGDSGYGRLVLNENHRNEITHFHDKTIADFVEIKKEIN
jgi:hypothetical protein